MNEHGEELQPGNDSGQRGQWQQRAEGFIFGGVLLLVSWPLSMTYAFPWQHSQPVQWALVHGASMYALAVVAAVLWRPVARLSLLRPLKLVLASLLVALLLIPPLFGSFDIAYDLVRLVGNRWESTDVVWVLLLWVLVNIPLLVFVYRTPLRV